MRERVLIIGGATLTKDITSTLEAAGFKAYSVENYFQGLKKLGKVSPDLIILGKMLPMVNGWEACSRFRQMSDIPIILVGSDRSSQAVAKAIDQGADIYMVKPFNARELEARIVALLRRRKRKIAGTRAGSQPDRQDYIRRPLSNLILKMSVYLC